MQTLAADTHLDAERVLIELWRSTSAARKVAMVLSANRSARALALWQERGEREDWRQATSGTAPRVDR